MLFFSAVIGWNSTAVIGGSAAHGSPAVVFLDLRHPGIKDFYSTVPIDVVKVKSYVNCLLTLRVQNWRPRAMKFTSFQSGRCPLLLACSET